jgi:hypothetical protein
MLLPRVATVNDFSTVADLIIPNGTASKSYDDNPPRRCEIQTGRNACEVDRANAMHGEGKLLKIIDYESTSDSESA